MLVAYYSATGHTADVAKAIADAADGDLFELTPEREYSSGDLNWNDEFSRVNSEHNDESLRDIPLNVTSPDGGISTTLYSSGIRSGGAGPYGRSIIL